MIDRVFFKIISTMARNDSSALQCKINCDSEPKNKCANTGMALMWTNLTYYKKSFFGHNYTTLLCQLKGRINFGTLTALMGPSGAGKTTLLRCINGVDRRGLSANAEIYVSKTHQIYPCYIVQDIKEHLLTSLSVRESLIYASLLKNRGQSRVLTKNDKTEDYTLTQLKENVDKLLYDLMLTDCGDNKISRCSGGEQKRVVIAMELTAQIKPNLICIDEPTSGLDSNAAEQTVLCLQNIARKHNLAIVTSIHQPNSDVLMMFDQLYVLAKGGYCVYFGVPLQLSEHLRECRIQCLEYQTPIEALLKVASNANKVQNNNNANSNLLSEDVSRLVSKTYEMMHSLSIADTTDKRRLFGGFNDINRVFNPLDMWYLLRRAALNSWIRQWKLNAFLIISVIAVILCTIKLYREDIGKDANCLVVNKINDTLYYSVNVNISLDDVNSRQESIAAQNMKFIFFLIIFIMFVFLNLTTLTFSLEVKMFANEHRNRWYSTGSYYWAKTITELPLMIITLYIYCWIGYYGSSQPDMHHWYNGIYLIPQRFLLFQLFIQLGVLNTQGLSMVVSIIFSNNYRLAQVINIIPFLIMFYFCGFFIPINNFSKFTQNITNFSFIKLCFQSLIITIFGRNRCNTESVSGYSMMMITFDIDDNQLWSNFCWLLVHLLFWRVIALFALIVKANPDSFHNIVINKRNHNNAKQLTITNSNTNPTFSVRL